MTQKTLFVSIANYKDPETLNTVDDLLKNSSGDLKIRICIFSQIDPEDTSFDALDSIPEVHHVRCDFREAKGVCWARAQVQKHYMNEDYYLQIDSHIIFAENWDRILVEDHNNALTYGRKAILTAYPCAYEFNDKGERFIPNRLATKFDMNVVNIIPSAAAAFKEDEDFPEQEFFIAGGFLFTTGDFVINVPYDEELFFLGEEITLAIRAYTAGYFIFSPTKFVCAHLYQIAQPKNQKRNNFWDKQEDRTRKLNWTMRDKTSRIKVQHICRGEWFGKYGIQDRNLYLEYYSRLRAYDPRVDLQRVIL